MSRPKPVLLLILDGWGHREETANNAIDAIAVAMVEELGQRPVMNRKK